MSGDTIFFFGLGRMGAAMAGHLLQAGHRVVGVDPDPAAAEAARRIGVETAGPDQLEGAQVVLSSLPGDDEARQVYLGGLLERIGPAALCVDLSTVDVELSRQIAEAARVAGHQFLDCPVSGTSTHAREGTLAVMAGGDRAALERARPYLATFSSSIHHMGSNGAGLEMKLITNRLLNAHVVAIAEAIVAIEDAGLDVDTCLELLRGGAVPRLLDYKAGPMARRDHDPRFTVDLMAKDLDLADRRRPAGPVTEAAATLLRLAAERGWGSSDISAVVEVLQPDRS